MSRAHSPTLPLPLSPPLLPQTLVQSPSMLLADACISFCKGTPASRLPLVHISPPSWSAYLSNASRGCAVPSAQTRAVPTRPGDTHIHVSRRVLEQRLHQVLRRTCPHSSPLPGSSHWKLGSAALSWITAFFLPLPLGRHASHGRYNIVPISEHRKRMRGDNRWFQQRCRH
jgi:hypothetical protein